MVKIKYKGTKIETDSIDEAIAILESLKVPPTYTPLYTTPQVPNIWPYEHNDWQITCTGTGTIGVPTTTGESSTVTSN